MPENKDVLSDPDRAWNAGRAFALAEDIVLQMSRNRNVPQFLCNSK